MTVSHPLAAILDDPVAAGQVAVALTVLVQVDEQVFVDAIRRIDHAETLGPMLDPTAWLDGRRSDNARDHKRILRALLELRRALPEVPDAG